MNTYTVKYDDGSAETITADTLDYDGENYVARTAGELTALIRPPDVRSIVLSR